MRENVAPREEEAGMKVYSTFLESGREHGVKCVVAVVTVSGSYICPWGLYYNK